MIKNKERLLWIFIIGVFAGFSALLLPYALRSHSPINHTNNSLLDFLKSYLDLYYWDSKDLNNKDLWYGASKGMYEATGDPYTDVFPPSVFHDLYIDVSGNMAGIGIYLQKKKGIISILSVIPSSPAYLQGLRKYDQITSINAVPVGNFSIDDISHQIQGKQGTSVILEIFRPSTQTSMKTVISRALISLPSVYAQLLPHNLLYIKIVDFNNHTLEETRSTLEQFAQASGIIMDLRENPGGQIEVASEIASLFLPKGTLVTTVVGKNSKDSQDYRTSQQPIVPSNKSLVVLVDGQTASAAEILSAALRENKRGLLVGEKTFGKSSVQTIFPLHYAGDDFGVKITVAHYLTPNGKNINHKGIAPDIKISIPPLSTLESGKISFLLENSILEKDLGKGLQKPLTPAVWKRLLSHLKEEELSLPPNLLRRVIQEQKDIADGKIYTVEWGFDKQLQKAIKLFQSPENKLFDHL